MTATCIECGEPIDRLEQSHAAHESHCEPPDGEDWSCRCDAVAHVRCCRACTPLAMRLAAAHARQIALGEFPVQRVPMGSTRGGVKKHSGS